MDDKRVLIVMPPYTRVFVDHMLITVLVVITWDVLEGLLTTAQPSHLHHLKQHIASECPALPAA